MKKLLMVAACLALLVSCSKTESGPDSSENRQPDFYSGSSYQRALDVANTAPDLFAGETTKSFGKRVKHGQPVISGNVATKSGQPDTLMYIFNYEGNDGYVMVPKDERKGFVLAYSDKGSFNIADTSENAIAKYVLESAMEFCEIPVPEETPETKTDIEQVEYKKYAKYFSYQQGNGCGNLRPAGMYNFEVPGQNGYPDSYYETTGCKTVLNVMYLAPGDVDPLLTTKWGQGYPYNMKAPVIDGQNAWGGCVAAAMAQIMAYHAFPAKYPTGTYIQGVYYGDTDTRIETLRNTTGEGNPGPGFRDYVSRLYRVIGNEVGMMWGLDGSGAFSTNVPSALRWFGYTNTPGVKTYDIAEVEQSLNAGCPVYVDGRDTSGTTNENHAYIIDGYKMMHRGYNYYFFDAYGNYHRRTSTIYSTPNPPQRYVHCNFGWDGQYNGFYLNAVFDTSDRDSWFETKSNYNGNMKMITFIRP